MAKNIELEQLVINKLTQEQFDNIEVKNPDELYFVTDAENDGGKGAQVEEMPEATEMNAGQIVQYVGETIPDAEATATIAQTVGDSLTDLKVEAKKFEKASGFTEAGSMEFVAESPNITLPETSWEFSNSTGNLYVSIDPSVFFAKIQETVPVDDFMALSHFFIGVNELSIGWGDAAGWVDIIGTEHRENNIVLSEWGITIQGERPTYSNDGTAWIHLYPIIEHNWMVNNVAITISDYGISYSGVPSNGDTLKVDYTPFVGGYEKGYFYVNQARLSESIVTIEQTVGNSLSILEVDVKQLTAQIDLSIGDSHVFECFTDSSRRVEHISGDDIFSFDLDKLYQYVLQFSSLRPNLESNLVNPNNYVEVCIRKEDANNWYVSVYVPSDSLNNPTIGDNTSGSFLNNYGISISGDVVPYTDYVYRVYFSSDKIWKNNDSDYLSLSDYGITYSGIPAIGDTVTVSLPYPNILGYHWNQINVQPASKENGGIEWVTKLDLPADYPDSYRWSCCPIWTIPGGVPDGTYEFYVQSLCGTNNMPEYIGIHNYTVKVLVRFYTKNDRQRHIGSMAYVLDGTWTGDDNFRPTESMIYNAFKKGDNNLYFWYNGFPFVSYLPAYAGAVAVPGMFKMSAWKNIDSGETYIPEGMLYMGKFPDYETSISGNLSAQPLCPPVNYPSFYSCYENVNIDENRQYARIYPDYIFNDGTRSVTSAQSATIDIKSKSGGTFYATIKNKNGSCVVQELESSGDLKNVQLGVGNDGGSYIYFNNTDLSSVDVSLSLTGIYDTRNSVSITFESWVTPSSFTPLAVERVGAPITSLNLGKTLQYTQESTDEYTKGYFYKSSGTPIQKPATMEVTWQSVDSVEILIDAEELAQAIGSYVGWDTSYVKNELLRYNRYYAYYENEGSPYIYADFFGSFSDSSILGCFTINGDLPDKYIEFNAGNYKDSAIEVIDGKWEQVNVQPASNTVQVTEIPEASEENVGKILQYIGTPTSEYDQGYFYKCTADGWVQVNVQPSSGGGGEAPSELPNLTGNEGRFLSNNGSELEWADIPTSLPAQEGHSGKYLTTDGENASWVEIELPESTDGVELPDQTGNSGKFLTTDGANLSWAEVSGGTSGFTKEEADELYVSKDESGAAMFDTITRAQGQITVPDKPGTLALIEDIESIMGDLSSALDTINGEEI